MGHSGFRERLFRVLLRCYPAEFREEYGGEMASVFRRRARSEPLWALWPEILADAVTTGLKEHLAVLKRDLRYAIRMLVKAPTFTIAAVFTIALGIGASMAIFSVVHAVVLRPLPFRDPARLVSLWGRYKQNSDRRSVSVLNYLSWRDQAKSFESMGAFSSLAASLHLTGDGEPERLASGALTASMFDVLGVRPVLGSSFTADEEKRGSDQVVMLGEDFWRRRFGGDPGMIGRSLDLDGVRRQVVGIAPPSLDLFDRADVWIPIVIDASHEDRGNRTLSLVARLRSGIGLRRAEAEMTSIAAQLEKVYPASNIGWGVQMERFSDWIVPQSTRTALSVLFGAVMLVLLIACANVANLLLARAGGRSREIAMRLAIGAGRSRLARQFLTESISLAVLGGIAGMVLAFWMVSALRPMLPQDLPRRDEITVDGTVLALTLGITVLAGILFGAVPLLRTRTGDLMHLLKRSGRSSTRDRSFLRSTLVVVEVSFATILVAGASLLFQTFVGLQTARLGFDPHRVLTAQISLPEGKYQYLSAAFFYRDLLARLNVPGIDSAAISSGVPFGAGDQTASQAFAATDQSARPAERMVVSWRSVSRDYFKIMRIPLLRGRSYTAYDERKDSPDVVVVSASLARQIWRGEDAVGRELVSNGKKRIVVGVVADTLLSARRDDNLACVYYLAPWFMWRPMTVVLRTTGDPQKGLSLLRARVKELDPGLALFNVKTMEQWLAADEATPRTNALLMSLFAVIALVLALIGLYGVISYTVSHRTAEIGIRMALGATKGQVVRLVVRQGLAPVLAGLVGGLGCAVALAQAFSTLLYGIAPWDVRVSLGTSAILLSTALMACAVPAMRAVQVDPAAALREE